MRFMVEVSTFKKSRPRKSLLLPSLRVTPLPAGSFSSTSSAAAASPELTMDEAHVREESSVLTHWRSPLDRGRMHNTMTLLSTILKQC